MSERRDFWFHPTIAELRELLDKASPVPWYPTTTAGQSGALTCHASGPDHPRPNQLDWHPQAVADSYLIAAMRNSLWQLLDIISDLAAIEPGDGGDGHREQCVLCGVYVVEWAKDAQGRETGLVPIEGHAHHLPTCPWRRAGELCV